ncbi:PREDICTED: uncharacterized protein LOC109187973 [Ipomoea nil]|uniref:uncharacterized protein LOC109187973 n=1 Tax=Ipomoea nil TaxID=35883 RepID=UPI000900BBED|nr:PREDICTED: uncharacterized protein LOC109187973 [Ipomoea nil]
MAAPPGAAEPPPRTFADILPDSNETSPLRPPERFKGMPAVTFSDRDVSQFSQKFKYALVGKFAKGRPSMADLRKTFDQIVFGGAFSLGLIDQRHVLLNFDHETDFQRCWLRKSWSIRGYIMRIFKWTLDFRPDMESPIVPVWIAFEGLPPHLQDKRAIYSIANLIGKPLKVDASTLAHNRPSVARVCIELNVCNTPPKQVWITNGSYGGFAQQVSYEYIPPYCLGCRKFGHSQVDCRNMQTALQPEPRREAATETPPANQQPLLVPPRKRWRPVHSPSPSEEEHGDGSAP